MTAHVLQFPGRAAEKNNGNIETESPSPNSSTGFSSWFGGKHVKIGPRIGPVLDSFSVESSSGDESSDAILAKQREVEDGNAIQYRTCSWQKVMSRAPA